LDVEHRVTSDSRRANLPGRGPSPAFPLSLLLPILFALASCATTARVTRRDQFPLDPREGLPGPFPERVATGWSRLISGDAAGAEAAFRSAEGQSLAAEVGLVEALVLGGRAQEASKRCSSLFDTGEATLPLLVACGEARARESDPAEAYALYRRGLTRTSDRPGLVQRTEELRLAARDALSEKARDEANEGRWDEARHDVARARDLAPDSVALVTQAGDIESAAGHPESALALYREANRLDPKSPEIAEKLGDLTLETGALDLAVATFDELARDDPRYAGKAEDVRLAFRVANWPEAEREAATAPRLTRTAAAQLVWWMCPEVREAKVESGVIATDVIARRDSRVLTRALALGLLEADVDTHRASPDGPLTAAAAARLLLRLLGLVVPQSQSLPCPRPGRRAPRSAVESIQAAQACGLLPHIEGYTVSGPIFTRSLDRIRALADAGKS
jgi:tetratricopeptide (TPR) repeat protein